MYIHCLPATKLYSNGYIGWYTFSRTVFDSIKNHKFLRDRQETPAADKATSSQQRTSSQPPLKSAKYDTAAASSSSDADSSRTSWESVKSSDSEFENTTEKLAKVWLEHGPVPQAEDKDTVAEAKPYKCHHPMCGKEGVPCFICQRWYDKFKDFEQFKDVPQRSKARPSAPRTWIEGGYTGEQK